MMNIKLSKTLNIISNEKKKDFFGTLEITKEQIKSTVDNKQLLRQWDNIPKRAKAQEVVSNRIIYGNYKLFINYNVIVETKSLSVFNICPKRKLKLKLIKFRKVVLKEGVQIFQKYKILDIGQKYHGRKVLMSI